MNNTLQVYSHFRVTEFNVKYHFYIYINKKLQRKKIYLFNRIKNYPNIMVFYKSPVTEIKGHNYLLEPLTLLIDSRQQNPGTLESRRSFFFLDLPPYFHFLEHFRAINNFLYLKIVPFFSWAFPARVSLLLRDLESLLLNCMKKNLALIFPCQSQHLAVCWIRLSSV